MGVFYNCPITEIKLPASIETIEVNAFIGCPLLKTVTFENESKLKFINGTYNSASGSYHGAFYDLPKLELIDMSGCSQIEKIGTMAFYYCSNLTLVKIGTTTPPSCGSSAFAGINSSARLYVPDGCEDIYKSKPEWSRFFIYELY